MYATENAERGYTSTQLQGVKRCVCVSHVNRRVVKSQFCLTDPPLSVFQLCASNKYYNYLLDSYCDKYCAVITWKRCNLSDR